MLGTKVSLKELKVDYFNLFKRNEIINKTIVLPYYNTCNIVEKLQDLLNLNDGKTKTCIKMKKF
jgi:hypothetical protein